MTQQNESKSGLEHWAVAASFAGLGIIATAFLISSLEIANADDFFGAGIAFGAVFGAIGVVLGIICRKMIAGWVAIAIGAICIGIMLTLLLWTDGQTEVTVRDLKPKTVSLPEYSGFQKSAGRKITADDPGGAARTTFYSSTQPAQKRRVVDYKKLKVAVVRAKCSSVISMYQEITGPDGDGPEICRYEKKGEFHDLITGDAYKFTIDECSKVGLRLKNGEVYVVAFRPLGDELNETLIEFIQPFYGRASEDDE